MHKKHMFLCTKNSFSSHINTNKKLHLAALMSVVFLCVYTFLFLNPLPAYMDNTKATPAITSSELNVTTSDISINTSVDSPSGTFRESSPANISVTTDNYSGYTLSIDSSLDNEYSNKLVNSNETAVINSISSASTESDFTSNTWGIKPSKVEGNDNTNFIPAPSYDNTVTIDTTSESSIEPTVYTMSIATKVDYSLPADTYSNTYVIMAVGNPTLYTIEYDKNVDGDVSNMPATQASDTEDASITLSSTTPTSAKKYKFLSWCDGTVTDNDGIPSCDGDVYEAGDEYNLDQTTDNHVVLYGMWDRTATLAKGSSFRSKITSLASGSSNIVAVKTADSLPEDFSPTTNNVVSTNDSPDIYAWWDNTDDAKTIYIYTDAGRIKANADSKDTFYYLSSLKDVSGIYNWDTSNVVDMSRMFYWTRITNIDALSTGQREGKSYVSWDVSNVTNMSEMFCYSSITNIDGAINWNTSNVQNMNKMFYSAPSLANISGASQWNTSNVVDMGDMFHGAHLTNLNGVEDWDVSNVTLMNEWNSNLENTGMFGACRYLEDISALENWNVSNVTDMHYMFYATKITNIDALSTGQREGKSYVSWDVSNVTNMGSMFFQSSLLEDIDGVLYWNTSKVTDMSGLFGRTKITNIDALSTGQREGKDYVSWDVSKVTDMRVMFQEDGSLIDISGASNWDTSNVTNMAAMFERTKINNIDSLATGQREGKDYVSWNISRVTNMNRMFSEVSTLTNIDGAINWDTSNVTSMIEMFYRDTSLTNVNGAINWDTSNLVSLYDYMASIFTGCSSLEDISGLTYWDTSKITDMNQMFSGTKIKNLDALSTGQREGKNYVSWDVSKVTNMRGMFSSISTLEDVSGISNWDVSNTTNMSRLFYNCKALTDSDDLDPLNSWTINASLNKTDMFSGVPTSVLRPTWY